MSAELIVYVISDDLREVAKIGITNDHKSRLATIQGGSARRLSFVRLMVGTKEDEARLHSLFSSIHLSGEWFRFADAMLGDLGLRDARSFDLANPKEKMRAAKAAGMDLRVLRQAMCFWKNDQSLRTDDASFGEFYQRFAA